MKNKTLKVLDVQLNADGNYTLCTIPATFALNGVTVLSVLSSSKINLVINPDTMQNLISALHKDTHSDLIGTNLLYVPKIKELFGAFVSLEGHFIDDVDISCSLEIKSISENKDETVTLQITDKSNLYSYICPKSVISKLKKIADMELIGQQPVMNMQSKQLYALVPFPVCS